MPEQTANLREIHRWIAERTPEDGRVLDIGCGEGDLLAFLMERRNVRGTGIELSEQCVVKAVARGLSVHHGDVEEGMDHYSDKTFDIVAMSLAIQELSGPIEVIREAMRIGKRIVVVFPNFGHWWVRWQLGVLGQAPRTPSFPFTWHESPNRHFFTVRDWEALCDEQGWKRLDKGFLSAGRPVSVLPNLRAEVAMYLITEAG